MGSGRLNIGDAQKLKGIRSMLLQSQWISDAMGNKPGSSLAGVSEVIYQPDGKSILPCLFSKPPMHTLRNVFKNIFKRMGVQGRKVMQQYISHLDLADSQEAMSMLTEVFGDDGDLGKQNKASKKQKIQ